MEQEGLNRYLIYNFGEQYFHVVEEIIIQRQVLQILTVNMLI